MAIKKVSISAKGFAPTSVDCKVGDSVEWTNADTAPHAVALSPAPAGSSPSGDIAPNATFAQKFDTAGTYNYSDSHGAGSGTIVVS